VLIFRKAQFTPPLGHRDPFSHVIDFLALFFRRITSSLNMMYEELVDCCSNHHVTDQEDKIVWTLCKKGFL
jgi:hypothetical protein